MNANKYYTDTGIEPTPEMLAAHPELQVQFITPTRDADSTYQISSRFVGGLDTTIVTMLPPAQRGPSIDVDSAAVVIASLREIAARQAIDIKARELGGLPGVPVSDVEWVGTGFVRRYQGCDIYYSNQTGAHEVHGDIRAKYNAWRGA
jgi:hypothetical protein